LSKDLSKIEVSASVKSDMKDALRVFRLSIQGDEMIFRFAFARHHTDIVTADQRIQPGYRISL
jgi:hypothetical protein